MPTHITARDLKQRLSTEDRPPVINVLPEEYYDAKHIPGSVNIPHNNEGFTQRVLELVEDQDEPVIVYCANADCDASVKAAQTLEQAGFSNVMDFEDGTEGWAQAGFELEGSQASARS